MTGHRAAAGSISPEPRGTSWTGHTMCSDASGRRRACEEELRGSEPELDGIVRDDRHGWVEHLRERKSSNPTTATRPQRSRVREPCTPRSK